MSTATIQDSQRRVLGLARALLVIDSSKAEAIHAWEVLQPANEQEARQLLDAALVLLLQLASDPRLGGRDELLAKLTRLSLKDEAAT